jgi:hypothetical protein
MPWTHVSRVRNTWHRAAALLGMALAAGACGTDEGGLGVSGDPTRRSAGSAGEAAVSGGTTQPAPPTNPPPVAMPPPATDPVNATVIIRAEKIDARRIVARLIYAEKIEAASTAVADLRRDDNKLWETEGAKAELSFDELRADTIYTKEIRVGQLEAAQVFVKDLKIADDEGDGKDNGKGKGKDGEKDDD